MVARGTLQYEDFQVEGQMGSRALAVLIRAQEIASAFAPYNYVEIGSYLGRTLQPHLQDAECAHALSIDLRPDLTPDERGEFGDYRGISANDMIARLAAVCSRSELAKLECVTDTSDCLRLRTDPRRYHLALIDGEHTIAAAFRDFVNLLGAMQDDCIVMFDDTSIVLPAIQNAAALLEARGTVHHVAFGRGGITVMGLGGAAQAIAEGLEPALQIGAEAAERRYRGRASHSAVMGTVEGYIRNDPKTRRRSLRALKKLGYDIAPPAGSIAAE